MKLRVFGSRRPLALVITAVVLVAIGCADARVSSGSETTGSPHETPEFSLGDTGQHAGMVVDGPLTFSGQSTGDVTVVAGGVLTLNGQVVGDLIVEAGGRAEVLGMVIGNVVNKGGDVTIYGQVGGLVEEGGSTVLISGAVVSGSPVP
jgi:hypothetical protein